MCVCKRVGVGFMGEGWVQLAIDTSPLRRCTAPKWLCTYLSQVTCCLPSSVDAVREWHLSSGLLTLAKDSKTYAAAVSGIFRHTVCLFAICTHGDVMRGVQVMMRINRPLQQLLKIPCYIYQLIRLLLQLSLEPHYCWLQLFAKDPDNQFLTLMIRMLRANMWCRHVMVCKTKELTHSLKSHTKKQVFLWVAILKYFCG